MPPWELPDWIEGERARRAEFGAEEPQEALQRSARDRLDALRAAALAQHVSTATTGSDEPASVSSGKPRRSSAARRPADLDATKAKPLARNPRVLRYWRMRARATHAAVARANRAALKDSVQWLDLPSQAFDLCHDICSDTRAVAGALEWVRYTAGPAVALEIEAAALYRVPGTTQRDDWSSARARRKVALLVLLLMSPWELPRSKVTGSTSDEPVIVTAGLPQTGLVLLLRSAQRAPYHVRTLQRDLAEIDECTNLLLRWRTPRAKAQTFECAGHSEGVVNRYCIRAGMIRDAWKRLTGGKDAALLRAVRLQLASWLVWTPPPCRGAFVPDGFAPS